MYHGIVVAYVVSMRCDAYTRVSGSIFRQYTDEPPESLGPGSE